MRAFEYHQRILSALSGGLKSRFDAYRYRTSYSVSGYDGYSWRRCWRLAHLQGDYERDWLHLKLLGSADLMLALDVVGGECLRKHRDTVNKLTVIGACGTEALLRWYRYRDLLDGVNDAITRAEEIRVREFRSRLAKAELHSEAGEFRKAARALAGPKMPQS